MNVSVDMAYKSLNKHGEELCGDKVELVQTSCSKIMILADGMGSGIRANILATMTSKILGTLFTNDLNIDEAVSTIARTLPVSSVNGVAYSTFSILQIFNNKDAYLVEFDNPGCIFIRNNQVLNIPFSERTVEGKKIREYRFKVQVNDAFVLMSDGCIYCGTGDIMNYGWDWKSISAYALKVYGQTNSAQHMAAMLSKACEDLYLQEPSDDTTLAVARVIQEKVVSIFTGPPSSRSDDWKIVRDFMNEPGVKIVCGGVTGQIAARELKEELVMSVGELDPEIPPVSFIKGIDLVTEGVITLNKVIEILTKYNEDDVSFEVFDELAKNNGAAKIANYLIDSCTKVNLYVGKAVNENYSSKSLPFNITARKNIIHGLEDALRALNKNVSLYFY
ncbi:stage II sporulation protein E [uncultured Roseburia sp.]|uniref:Serine/threonine-protein phosphatase n=1 Tax=Brotonthovivens ammoniilytica TaxID=2981725 RepID=A0ABT2TGI7_9FIRM|nr:SpoIIE family protein phosphatase [Brotonthovivens ammoniilytica]MCU6761305.1 serine/threonine-protein phosphatase [Brotonthovivens ammoniilytica]SCI24782.1 stage II sporulation protein E [uncultured Roseburia sp.]